MKYLYVLSLLLFCIIAANSHASAQREAEPLELPENLEPITVENAARLQVIAYTPRLGELVFTSPTGNLLFALNQRADGTFIQPYTFPELQPFAPEFPVDRGQPINIGTAYSPTRNIRFSPHGQYLVSVDPHGNVTVYDTVMNFLVINQNIRASDAFDISSGALLATTHFDVATEINMLCIFSLSSMPLYLPKLLCQPIDAHIVEIKFIRDDILLAATTDQMLIIDVPTMQVLRTFDYSTPAQGTFARLLMSEDHPITAPQILLSQDGYVSFINLDSGLERPYPNGRGIASEIFPLGANRYFLFVVPSNNASSWNVLALDARTKIQLLNRDIFDGESILISNFTGRILIVGRTLYETEGFETLFKFRVDDHPLSFSHDGQLLFVDNRRDARIDIYGIPAA